MPTSLAGLPSGVYVNPTLEGYATPVHLSPVQVQPKVAPRFRWSYISTAAWTSQILTKDGLAASGVTVQAVHSLEPKPGDTVYDPTGGSGGMLVHSAEYREQRHHATSAQYFAQGNELAYPFAAGSPRDSHGLADVPARRILLKNGTETTGQ